MVIKVRQMKSIKNKAIGLINAKKAQPVLLKTRFGIHTFCMRFPIDVLILNRTNIVVKLHQNLLPNNIFIWNIKYNTVIELPAGYISSHKIKLGDYIELILE